MPIVSRYGDRAGQEVVNLNHGTALPGMWVSLSHWNRVNGCRHHVVFREMGDSLFHGHGGKELVQGLVHDCCVLGPFWTGVEARIFQPLRLTQGVTNPVPVVLVASRPVSYTHLTLPTICSV